MHVCPTLSALTLLNQHLNTPSHSPQTPFSCQNATFRIPPLIPFLISTNFIPRYRPASPNTRWRADSTHLTQEVPQGWAGQHRVAAHVWLDNIINSHPPLYPL